MKNSLRYLFLSLVLFIPLWQASQAQTINRPRIIDSGAMPVVFAPGILSTPYAEWSLSLSPDGNTAYSSMGEIYWTIVCSHRVNGIWLRPQVVSFSGRFRDTDPFVTPDGSRIFFISSRPFLPGAPPNVPQRATHIWYADHTNGDNWGTPHHLDTSINLTDVSNYAPSVSAKGSIYYCSRRNGLTRMQSFYAERTAGGYAAPKQLVIKGAAEIQDPFIAPDESYLVYLDGSNICISFKDQNGWTAEEKLGPEVNNGNNNSSPYVSADGKYLYFTSDRIQGFYKRDLTKPALTYDDLVKENGGLFNNKGNILMIPIHLAAAKKS